MTSSKFRRKEAKLDTPRRQQPNVKETYVMMRSNRSTKDLEHEVKEAEPGKKTTTKEASETEAVAMTQKGNAEEPAARAAPAASAASTAAADGHSITKSRAAASAGTVASEAQETKGKDEKILALKQERKMTAKHEKERIREISKKIKKCIRDNKRTKRQVKIQKKILEEVKGTRNISSIKSVKERILIPKVKNKEGEAIKNRQGIANVFAKFYEDMYEGEEGYTERDMDSRTGEEKNRLQPTQLHPRIYNKRDSRYHRPTKKRESERQQWNTS